MLCRSVRGAPRGAAAGARYDRAGSGLLNG
jgi:hypothetical protein